MAVRRWASANDIAGARSEVRAASAEAAEAPSGYTAEMATFGGWFVSRHLPDDWAINQLCSALNIAGKVEVDHLVVRKLAELSASYPRETTGCLRLMAEGDKVGWHIYGWQSDARTILSNARRAGGETREAATSLTHYLGSRGYPDFRDLLN